MQEDGEIGNNDWGIDTWSSNCLKRNGSRAWIGDNTPFYGCAMEELLELTGNHQGSEDYGLYANNIQDYIDVMNICINENYNSSTAGSDFSSCRAYLEYLLSESEEEYVNCCGLGGTSLGTMTEEECYNQPGGHECGPGEGTGDQG